MQFGLFYFSGDGSTHSADKYRLLTEGAKFADRHGFSSIWIPERHFHDFGGLYPNPAVINAALAMITERVQLRSGSVVLPLQEPLRVAEEWAVVDNLSNGRVGLTFAYGWHVDDFVLLPENYRDRQAVMWREIETVQRLWEGQTIERKNGSGQPVQVRTLPRPVQPKLPIWITCHSDYTFTEAGRLGANVLTSLLHSSVEELAPKIQLYRQSRVQHGHDPAAGKVSLMMHTFIGEDYEQVKRQVQAPFCNYLKTHFDLIESLVKRENLPVNLAQFTESDIETLLQFGFERYLDGKTLIGTVETCEPVIQRLREIGVDEVACLIDFGIDFDLAIASLEHLNHFKDRIQQSLSPEPVAAASSGQYSALSFF
ncbi:MULTISPECIES: LLM class flavin-dependent oxidoreductase [Trichocoleus]|uniref:LLM class flavin-dependent oxidoreductase n=1 Tax=Trichocoleus desertorum GB2-A4 TaxID=2933944 RepID=A0ABV0JDR0_9CYAN|nr:LLM class flavin-dependent oxidoreductase [Trichocoleus sp. FACHB-46]MBD1865330.1 LLM class flavin-dependent oxidoreductase [Trichocoleus sp. FACHB-46]